MAELKMKDVGKTYGGKVEVLKGIDMDIKTGELIVFVGPSGCGKSTLLRMVAGLEKITAGTLEIDGEPMRMENAICIHEEDSGILWKHWDFRTDRTEVRRGRRLVISSIATVGNYEYGEGGAGPHVLTSANGVPYAYDVTARDLAGNAATMPVSGVAYR